MKDSILQARRIHYNYPETSEGPVTQDTIEITGDLNSYSIDSIFALMEDLKYEDYETFTGTFNSELGYPINFSADMGPDVQDGFWGISIQDFETLP